MIFLFFSSSLACLEPELELFEVWEINVRQIIIIANGINSQTPKLQRALTWVLDELERNQKRGYVGMLSLGAAAGYQELLPTSELSQCTAWIASSHRASSSDGGNEGDSLGPC